MDYAAVYREMHNTQKHFSGYTMLLFLEPIVRLIKQTNPFIILDYGSGKGYQYLSARAHMAWGGQLPHCYDPGVLQLSKKPKGPFDAIICTDVMEHIEREDVDAVLADIFGLLDLGTPKFVFMSISCRPAEKTFPNGRNVHVTVESPDWWEDRLLPFRKQHHNTIIHVVYDLGDRKETRL